MVTMFFPHPNKKLHDHFSLKPYQGSNPSSSRFLFFGLDANYDPEIEDKPYFSEIISYLEDGVDYWKRRGVHHPFRLPHYRCDGALYHRRFAEIGFGPEHAEQVSFVELIDVPTYGTSKLVLNDLKSTHIDRLLDWVQNGSAEFIFIPIGVARLLKRTSQFSWLPDRSMGHYKSLPILFRSDSKTVFSPYHFSCIGRGCLKKDRDLQIRDIGALIRNQRSR